MKSLSSTKRKNRYLAFNAALIAVAIVLMTPINSAHARQQILTGTVEAQYVCHDGANRGATVGLQLTWHKPTFIAGSSTPRIKDPFATIGGKSYYTGTTCLSLSGHFSYQEWRSLHKRIFYVWHQAGGHNRECRDFNIRWVNNGKKVWVQNGGHTIYDVNCVLKDGL